MKCSYYWKIHSGPPAPLFLEYFEIFYNFWDYLGILWNILENFEIFGNNLEYFGIYWNILEYFEIFLNILEYFGMFWNATYSLKFSKFFVFPKL